MKRAIKKWLKRTWLFKWGYKCGNLAKNRQLRPGTPNLALGAMPTIPEDDNIVETSQSGIVPLPTNSDPGAIEQAEKRTEPQAIPSKAPKKPRKPRRKAAVVAPVPMGMAPSPEFPSAGPEDDPGPL